MLQDVMNYLKQDGSEIAESLQESVDYCESKRSVYSVNRLGDVMLANQSKLNTGQTDRFYDVLELIRNVANNLAAIESY